jgi:hypothetical protein
MRKYAYFLLLMMIILNVNLYKCSIMFDKLSFKLLFNLYYNFISFTFSILLNNKCAFVDVSIRDSHFFEIQTFNLSHGG